MTNLTIKIEDISEGKKEAFMAEIKEIRAIVFGGDYQELFDGILSTIELANDIKSGKVQA